MLILRFIKHSVSWLFYLVLFAVLSACSAPVEVAQADPSPPSITEQGFTLTGHLQQGELLVGRLDESLLASEQSDFRNELTLTANKTKIIVNREGRFVIGLGRDAPDILTVSLSISGKTTSYDYPVAARHYDIQHIDGLPKQMVTPSEQALIRIKADIQAANQARTYDSDYAYFDSGWIWPTTGIVTGVYGAQRVLNGEPKRPHFGIDIAAATGTHIYAPADGIVTLRHDDMYYSGATLFINHGFGITSAFLHMQQITVQEGDMIRQGDIIGTVGSTGRSTGPHLDWRVDWQKVRIDAARLIHWGRLCRASATS